MMQSPNSGAETVHLAAYDIVVIGGGLAGLTAAVRAQELGMSVVLLEQGDGERYPCNSRYSGGIVHIAFHDPHRPYEQLMEVIQRTTGGDVDANVADAVARDGRRLLRWLQSHGTRFMRFNFKEGYKWSMAPPRRRIAGADWEGRGPDVTLRRLSATFVRNGGAQLLSTKAQTLAMENDRCVGVRANRDGKEEIFRGDSTIIADGGFQANPDLFRAHIGPNPDGVFQRGAANSHGDGIRMAQQVGAALTRCDRFYGHLLHRDALTNPKLWPYPQADELAVAGIVVGIDGQRLYDEGIGGIGLANMLARRADRSPVFAVFDKKVWDGPGRTARIPANPLMAHSGATLHSAATVRGLADATGIDAEGLAATVSKYNEAIVNRRVDTLNPPRKRGSVPQPLDTPSFMAVPLLPGITYTMGGLSIDGHGAVLRTDGSAIHGLFAAGASTGGLEGGDFGYVGGLIKAGVFGLRAAEKIADLSKV
jgi:fumarate reductase flavoprotein subunit